MNASTGGSIFLAFLGGAAVGAVVALLTAPRSGAESRQRLRAVPKAIREAYGHASVAARDAFVRAYNEETMPAQAGGGTNI